MAGRESGRDERGDRGRRGRPGTGSAPSPGARTSRPASSRTRRTAPKTSRRGPRAIPKARRRRPAAVLGLSTTRRAAMFAIVVCALALSVAVPLRTYLAQRDEVQIQEQRQAQLREQVGDLEQRKAQLSDPAQVQAEARKRLRYVLPGETPYLVELPGDHDTDGQGQPAQQAPQQQSWYETLWNAVTGAG
jgi:cell division protein FtsB